MNYQKAKEIVEHPENYSDGGPLLWGQVHHARGFLDGYGNILAKAEKLVEALEGLIQAATDFDCQICGNGTCHDTCARYQAEEILKEWHKENKEGE